jgi:hypothetical protein
MTGSTRAFLISGLIALPGAALLYLFSALGLSSAWPAMVHLTVFGWITAMILAVNYHTMPVFAARDFPSTRLIWGHWAVFSAGVTLATTGMLASWRDWAIIGLLFECAAALLFLANTILLFPRGPRRQHHAPPTAIADQPRVDRIGTRATKAAGLALPLALMMLLEAQLGWISGAWVLPAEHLATLGWLMLMIVGVAYHVLPRFSGYGTRGSRWARLQLGCHLGALTLMVPALGFGWSQLFAVSGLLMALALGLFAWTVWPTLNCRLQIADCRLADTQSTIYNRVPTG